MLDELIRKLSDNLKQSVLNYYELIDMIQEFREQLTQGYDEDKTSAYIQTRNQLFGRLEQLELERQVFEKRIIELTGVDSFSLEALRSCAPLAMWTTLRDSMEQLRVVLEKTLELDAQVIGSLQMEMENTKLKLNRLQGIKRMKSAYLAPVDDEARFIDKSK